MYDYKTKFVNSPDKTATLRELWAAWEPEAFSLWFVHYDKLDGECVEEHVTNNMMNGFMQRIDEKLRKDEGRKVKIQEELDNLARQRESAFSEAKKFSEWISDEATSRCSSAPGAESV